MSNAAQVILMSEAKRQRNLPLDVLLAPEVIEAAPHHGQITLRSDPGLIEAIKRCLSDLAVATKGRPRADVLYISALVSPKKTPRRMIVCNCEVFYTLCLETFVLEINLVVPYEPNDPDPAPVLAPVFLHPSRSATIKIARLFAVLAMVAIAVAGVSSIGMSMQNGLKYLNTRLASVVTPAEQLPPSGFNVPGRTVNYSSVSPIEESSPTLAEENSVVISAGATNSNLLSKEAGAHASAGVSVSTKEDFLGVQILRFVSKYWFADLDVRPISTRHGVAVRAEDLALPVSKRRGLSMLSASTIR
jgi:hypothetical protein